MTEGNVNEMKMENQVTNEVNFGFCGPQGMSKAFYRTTKYILNTDQVAKRNCTKFVSIFT